MIQSHPLFQLSALSAGLLLLIWKCYSTSQKLKVVSQPLITDLKDTLIINEHSVFCIGGGSGGGGGGGGGKG